MNNCPNCEEINTVEITILGAKCQKCLREVDFSVSPWLFRAAPDLLAICQRWAEHFKESARVTRPEALHHRVELLLDTETAIAKACGTTLIRPTPSKTRQNRSG